MRRKAIFLDRDGTLIEEREYLSRPDQVCLFPGVLPALRHLQEHGFLLFIVTNQSGVGRGYFTLAEMEAVHAHLLRLLQAEGVQMQKIYAAPEAPGQPSRGRKPSPQFLWDARDEFGVDLSASYMIGDKRIDLECGWNAGTRASLLVRTGYGQQTERELHEPSGPVRVVDSLADAATWILAQDNQTEARHR